MGKKLAIRGHSTRGKEVIGILEMMGGSNMYHHNGEANAYSYYISKNVILHDRLSIAEDDDFLIFTLEEFLEKYPFKVGDVVDRTLDYISCIIDNMRWNSEKCCVEYHLNYLNGGECGWHVSECLIKPENVDAIIGTKIESTGFMQIGKTCGIIFNEANYEDEVELQLGDYEIEVRDGRTYAVRKKPKYPKTYEECCEVLVGRKPNPNEISFDKMELCLVDLDNTQNIDFQALQLFPLNGLFRLLMCRSAYWKIAGKEMGLDGPWDSTYGCGEWGYWFGYSINEKKIYLQDSRILVNHTLVFPTAEMRDVFYENFKDLIEQCKELL